MDGLAKVAYEMQVHRASDKQEDAGNAQTVLPREEVNAILDERQLYLAGSASHRSKRLRAGGTANEGFRVRVSAFEIEDVDPPGVYYFFEATPEGLDQWAGILAFQQERFFQLPRNQVKFVSSQVGFVFMGSLYGVRALALTADDVKNAEGSREEPLGNPLVSLPQRACLSDFSAELTGA